jgi:hypothetical protein
MEHLAKFLQTFSSHEGNFTSELMKGWERIWVVWTESRLLLSWLSSNTLWSAFINKWVFSVWRGVPTDDPKIDKHENYEQKLINDKNGMQKCSLFIQEPKQHTHTNNTHIQTTSGHAMGQISHLNHPGPIGVQMLWFSKGFFQFLFLRKIVIPYCGPDLVPLVTTSP